jgi:hypothetical protein
VENEPEAADAPSLTCAAAGVPRQDVDHGSLRPIFSQETVVLDDRLLLGGSLLGVEPL